MEIIRALVVDDEKPARSRILDLLEKEADIQIAGIGRSGTEAVELILSNTPDLLFLDIQMPGLNGFEVLRQIGPERMPVTVFVTAYDKYAIQAFEAHAFDYLLKPFSDERFDAALRRARKAITTHRASQLGEKLASLLASQTGGGTGQDVSRPGQTVDRIVIKTGGRVTFLDVDEIDWIEAAGVYVFFHIGAKKHLYRSTIGQIQEKLDPRRFVRVHRSAAVNTDRIKELQPLGHGDYTVVLKDGTELKLSRKYRGDFETWLRQPL